MDSGGRIEYPSLEPALIRTNPSLEPTLIRTLLTSGQMPQAYAAVPASTPVTGTKRPAAAAASPPPAPKKAALAVNTAPPSVGKLGVLKSKVRSSTH